jgi:hypothetical protein
VRALASCARRPRAARGRPALTPLRLARGCSGFLARTELPAYLEPPLLEAIELLQPRDEDGGPSLEGGAQLACPAPRCARAGGSNGCAACCAAAAEAGLAAWVAEYEGAEEGHPAAERGGGGDVGAQEEEREFAWAFQRILRGGAGGGVSAVRAARTFSSAPPHPTHPTLGPTSPPTCNHRPPPVDIGRLRPLSGRGAHVRGVGVAPAAGAGADLRHGAARDAGGAAGGAGGAAAAAERGDAGAHGGDRVGGGGGVGEWLGGARPHARAQASDRPGWLSSSGALRRLRPSLPATPTPCGVVGGLRRANSTAAFRPWTPPPHPCRPWPWRSS